MSFHVLSTMMPPPLAWPQTMGDDALDFLLIIGMGGYLLFLVLLSGAAFITLLTPDPDPIRQRLWRTILVAPLLWGFGFLLPIFMMTAGALIGAVASGTLGSNAMFLSGYLYLIMLFAAGTWIGIAHVLHHSPTAGRLSFSSPLRIILLIAIAWLPLFLLTGQSPVQLLLSSDAWCTVGFMITLGILIIGRWELSRPASDPKHLALDSPDTRRLKRITAWATGLALVFGTAAYPTPWIDAGTLPGHGPRAGTLPFLFTAGTFLAFLSFLSAGFFSWLDSTLVETKRGRYHRTTRALILTGALFLLISIAGYRSGINDTLQAVATWHDNDQDTNAMSAKIKMWAALPQADREQLALGERVYDFNCRQCHIEEKILVGPPITEIARLYSGNPGGIVTWAKAPGKKRIEMPQMPSFQHLPDEKLKAVAKYMLVVGER